MFSSAAHEFALTGIAVVLTLGLYQLLYVFIKHRAQKKERIFAKLLRDHLYYPGLLLLSALVLMSVFPAFQYKIKNSLFGGIKHFLEILSILAFGFMAIKILTVLKELTYHHYHLKSKGHLQFRKVNTKFQLIQQVLNSIIILGSIAAALVTFPSIRSMGTTLLASAGVVGIILGFAAQKSIGTFFAGLQIAIAQPIRLGDNVIVENEFGTIGEINLTFVVVYIWDGRRLIVPISYFLEKTFQNWTRVSPEVIAKVKIRADYTIPVARIREQFNGWLQASELWDKRTSRLLVTNADDKTIELRATMSAQNSDDAWDLECYIREKLITHIQENYPGSLPKNRLFVSTNETESKWINQKEY
ncbi:MAG: mechanosensitive ion channel family protein [Bacteroidia bacterium]